MTSVNRFRFALVGLAFIVTVPVWAGEPAYDLDIEPQPLAKALKAFAEQSGLQVVYYSELADGEESPEVSGTMTADQAMTQLLASTGLTFDTMGEDTVVVETVAIGVADERGASDSKNLTPQPMLMAQNQTPPQETPNNQSQTIGIDGAKDEEEVLEEIIVTGSLIKGIAPKSSPIISISQEDIRRSGYATISEYLEFLPQNFADSPSDDGLLSSINEGSSINLRGLGANETLTLVNGRRLASASTFGSFVDISQIPVTAVDRVEILLDGASAVYGADAVAGVVNIILKQDQEGLLVRARYGTVTNGSQDEIRLSATGGHAWDSGNVALSYEYYDRNPLPSDERDFIELAPPAEPFDLIRAQQRQSIVLSASQNLSPIVALSIDGFATTEDSSADSSFLDRINTNITDTSLFALSAGLNAKLWGFDIDLSLGRSERKVEQVNRLVDSTSDLFRQFDNITDARSVESRASRSLMDLPAGQLKIGFGASIREEEIQGETTDLSTGNQLFFLQEGRRIKSAYGQLYVPIFGAQNPRPFLNDLELTLSLRWDEFDNFGSSTNPKIGVAWSPVEGLLLRGSYGTSFRAPEIRDLVGGGFAIAIDPEAVGLGTPFPELAPNIVLAVNGPNPDLEEQSSENFTVGMTIEPVSIPNLSVDLGYFNIDYDGRIDRPQNAIGVGALFTNSDPRAERFYILEPSLETIQRFFDGVAFPQSIVPSIDPNDPATWGPINLILDNRMQNMSKSAAKGIDFTVRYSWENTAGDFTFSSNMSYLLENSFAVTDQDPLIDNVDKVGFPVDLRLRSSLSYRRGNFSSSFIANYVDSYTDNGSDQEAEISSWTTFDLSAAYALEAMDTSIRFNVTNLFDTDPPFVASAIGLLGYDPTNASPRGRFIAVEIVKEW